MSRALQTTVVVGLLMTLSLLLAAPAGAVIDEPDIDSAADYTYRIDPDAGTVEVRIDLTVIADKPDQTTDEGVFQYFFNGYRLLIPHEAEDLRVTDQLGNELGFEREATEELSDVLFVRFGGNIYYRQQARLIIEFTLRAGEPGSDSIVRINPAYASFSAWTSPLLEEASVTVQLPAGYEDRSRGDTSFVAEGDGTQQQLVAAGIDPELYFSIVSVVNDDALELDVVELADDVPVADDTASRTVRILSWPGDDGWHQAVLEGVDDALPALVQLIGQPWPIDGSLTILESFTPYLDGYAGWYNAETDVIEVGDNQDDHTLIHELAHVWFHTDLFAHRWITEGLADLYAAETMASLGGDRPTPRPTSPGDPEAIPLEGFDSVNRPEQERWAYAASWGLMEAVADEIGMDGLATVIDSAAHRRLSYLGDGEPETVRTPADWHRFLDLVENAQGVDEGPVAGLIEEWVLADDSLQRTDAEVFERRQAARAQYFDLVDAGAGWAASYDVRNSMMFWRFSKAEGLMAEAKAVLTTRDELLAMIEPTGAELPSMLESLYESGDDSLPTVMAAAAEAGAEVREAHDHTLREPSLVERVGLIGTDLEAEADEAVAAFTADSMDRAITEANEVDLLMTGASDAGRLRIGLAVALVAVLLSGTWFIVVHRRPRPS